MRLNHYERNIEEKLSEFDLWITPSLGEIRDSDEFAECLADICKGLDILAQISDNYKSVSTCSANNISDNLINLIGTKTNDEIEGLLLQIANVLFMVTGKTDNNSKCQFPLYLSRIEYLYPYIVKGELLRKAAPRVLQVDSVVKTIASLSDYKEEQKLLLKIYFGFIISDVDYSKQLWSIGSSYINLKPSNSEKALISALAVFKLRGSITAKTGHNPEQFLRDNFSEWGMIAEIDYNTKDITVGELFGKAEVNTDVKNRKYDFILPFLSNEKDAKIFIQCQFYAGDSGSVSHKNVDQTSGTRAITKRKFPRAVFVEYLDGAGYYSSLNGDLRRILCMPDTKDFFQIRTAAIKLRRELQEIEYITILEVEHAILLVGNTKRKVIDYLHTNGYPISKVEDCIKKGLEYHLIIEDDEAINISEKRKEIVRRYCLLDFIALYGNPIASDKLSGNIVVSGFHINWGLPQSQLIERILKDVPALRIEWKEVEVAFNDLQWLIDKKYIISR
jgi:hypothetical protein